MNHKAILTDHPLNRQLIEGLPYLESSQFDNLDFLGLKKQEEDKVKNEMRQTQLRQTAMVTGSSMGVLSYGGLTPVGAYNADGFETPDSDDIE